jgi:hypothetical protein
MFINCLQKKKKNKKKFEKPLDKSRKMWYNIYRTEESLKPKRKAEREIKTMVRMVRIATSEAWFNEVYESGRVEMCDFCFYEEDDRKYVEYTVNEEQFDEVSKELGWM